MPNGRRYWRWAGEENVREQGKLEATLHEMFEKPKSIPVSNAVNINLSNEVSAKAQLWANKEGKTVDEFIVKRLKTILSNNWITE